jgi:hypothetical protein
MSAATRIGVIGDFEPEFHSHFATDAALYDAAAALGAPTEICWLPTAVVNGADAQQMLGRSDGLPASPERANGRGARAVADSI